MRVAGSYIKQANDIDSAEIFDLKTAQGKKESYGKELLERNLRTKAISLLENVKNLNTQRYMIAFNAGEIIFGTG